MKLSELRKIIKEEISKTLTEQGDKYVADYGEDKQKTKYIVKYSKPNNTYQVWRGDEIVTDFTHEEKAKQIAKRLNDLANIGENQIKDAPPWENQKIYLVDWNSTDKQGDDVDGDFEIKASSEDEAISKFKRMKKSWRKAAITHIDGQKLNPPKKINR